MTRLQDLYERGGQSPWLDNLNRAYLTSGHLADLVASGVRGLTSNPTIMAKAIAASSDYDEEFSAVLAQGQSVDEAYWDLVISDVLGALGVLRRIYDESDGGDGFVSIEVSPRLAHDTKATIESARQLHERIDQPNLFVKIPATREGLGAIEALIAEGRSINVTLIFSLERYREVIEAYLSGLEELARSGGDLSKVASVASFFVSRVDTEVDRRLEQIAKEEAGSPTATLALVASRQGRGRPSPARLPCLPGAVHGPTLGSARKGGRPGAATAVGFDIHEEPRLSGPRLRGHPRGPQHRQHDARGDARPLPRPRRPPADERSRPGRGRERRSKAWPSAASTWRTSRRCSRERASLPLPPPSTTCWASCRRRRTRSGARVDLRAAAAVGRA